jgi:hypothetical protein
MSGLSITILERENLLNEKLDRHIDEKREECLTRLGEVLQEGGKRYFAFFISMKTVSRRPVRAT